MNHEVLIPAGIMARVRTHLFQSELEQAAFFFASTARQDGAIHFTVQESYLVPPNGWDVQSEVYLEMSNAERSKILKIARDRSLAIIDCHSHPFSRGDVWFSPSDRWGIAEFAQYARWKLDGKPFAALVWGEDSVDGVVWQDDFVRPEPLGGVRLEGPNEKLLRPTGSWFRPRTTLNRFSTHER